MEIKKFSVKMQQQNDWLNVQRFAGQIMQYDQLMELVSDMHNLNKSYVIKISISRINF